VGPEQRAVHRPVRALRIFFVGQSLTGWRTYNSDQQEHGEPTVDYGSYLTTGPLRGTTFENWESEFLQMGAYVVLTVWLVQKGSSESKPPTGDPQLDADPRTQRHDEWRTVDRP
jgi:hypothetical protein